MSAAALGPEYFDAVYAGSDDPWGFTTREYEARKYAITLASLPRQRVARALEIGCSVGVLTAALAERCDSVLGVDVNARALELAAGRVPPHVELRQMQTPQEWPDGAFDLVVLSEVGYYQDDWGLGLLLRRSGEAVAPGGALVAVHWRHDVPDYPLSGDAVHARLDDLPGLVRTVEHVEADFRLDVLQRPERDETPDRLSVAARTGLL